MLTYEDYQVVWSGRDPLIPDREQVYDPLLASMPDTGWDPPRRKYTLTGKHTEGARIPPGEVS